jgi:hypothetical protein
MPRLVVEGKGPGVINSLWAKGSGVVGCFRSSHDGIPSDHRGIPTRIELPQPPKSISIYCILTVTLRTILISFD